MSEKLEQVVVSALTAVKLDLWGVEYVKSHTGEVIRVFINNEDNAITIEDCELASRQISSCLDVADIIPDTYNLEVSSPGLECRLFTIQQYQQFIGYRVKIKTLRKVQNRANFQGMILGTQEDDVELKLVDSIVMLDIKNIARAQITEE